MKNAQKKPNFVVVDRHFLNFSHDMAMGRNVANYTPPPNVQMMERDMAGDFNTGFHPCRKDGEIWFDQRWLMLIGIKP